MNKGLAVYKNHQYQAEVLPYDSQFKWVIPVRFWNENEEFILFAVWTKRDSNKEHSYIGQLIMAMEQYKDLLRKYPCVIAGDFNSNVNWDHMRKNNHSKLNVMLNEYSIDSAYHTHTKESFGEETVPTHIFRKELNRFFHIDYVYMSESLLEQITDVEVGRVEDWVQWSDHCPMVVCT